MIVIIASRYDEVARALARRWQAYDARLLTVQDLSVRGWRYVPDDFTSSTVVIEGKEVASEEISGVLTRLSSVPEQELSHIVPADRSYVAVEMMAFLVAWLSGLPCPVLNRPTPACLSGPNWRPEQWRYTAAKIGIPVCPVQRRHRASAQNTTTEPVANVATMTVVGKRCIGEAHEALAIQARRLAAAADVDLLSVNFSSTEPGAFLVGAQPWPDVAVDEVADAVLDYLQRDVSDAERC